MDDLTLLTEQCQTLQAQLDNELVMSKIFEEAARSLQNKCDSLQQTLSALYREREEPRSQKYSVFLLDADAVHFSDHAVSTLGGSGTALAILEKLKEFVSGIVRVRVYGNVAWLADVYADSGVVSRASDFSAWVQAFNAVSPWVEIVAMGGEQDASKQRVQDILRLHLQDSCCEQVVFAGEINDAVCAAIRECAREPEQVPFLDVSPRRSADPRIRGVDGKAFVTLEGIFRSEPLAPSTVSARPVQSIARDNLGRRIDPRVAPTQGMVEMVASRTFCNNHYLKGKCTYPRCRHNHTAKLGRAEMEALVFLGRSIKCRNGRGCEELECYAGHVCPRSSCDGLCGFAWEEHLPGVLMDDEARGERRKIKLGGEWHLVRAIKGGK